MARFALINTTDNSLVELRDYAVQPTDPEGKPRKWLPAPIVAQPAFDPLTEKVTGPTYTVGASDVTEVWVKIPLSAPEIAAAKDAAADAISGPQDAQLKILLLIANDLRAIKTKINAVIATGAATTPFPAGQVSPIDIAGLKTLIRNQLG